MNVAPLALAAAVATLPACIPSNGPMMNPGSDCLECHGGGGDAPRWTVAGTLYREPYVAGSPGLVGQRVHVTDARGRSFSLRTNRAGNFYTAEPVAFPLRVCAERDGVTSCMEDDVTSGSCNACHGPEGSLAPGGHERLFPIGAGSRHAETTCRECHGATRAVAHLRCASCHLEIDPDLDPQHTSSLSTSDPEIVVADFAPVSAACVRCHADARVDRTAAHPTGSEGTPPHEGATCLDCHGGYRSDKPWAGDFATPPSSWPAGSGQGCASCHTDGVPADGD